MSATAFGRSCRSNYRSKWPIVPWFQQKFGTGWRAYFKSFERHQAYWATLGIEAEILPRKIADSGYDVRVHYFDEVVVKEQIAEQEIAQYLAIEESLRMAQRVVEED